MRFENVTKSFKNSAQTLIECAKKVIVARGGQIVEEGLVETVRPDAIGYTFSWNAAGQEFTTTAALAESVNGWRVTLATVGNGKLVGESCLQGNCYWQTEDSAEAFDKSIKAIRASFDRNAPVPVTEQAASEPAKPTEDSKPKAQQNKYKLVPLGELTNADSSEETPSEPTEEPAQEVTPIPEQPSIPPSEPVATESLIQFTQRRDKALSLDSRRVHVTNTAGVPEFVYEGSVGVASNPKAGYVTVKFEHLDFPVQISAANLEPAIIRPTTKTVMSEDATGVGTNPLRAKTQIKAAYFAEVRRRVHDNDEEFKSWEDTSDSRIREYVDENLKIAASNPAKAIKEDSALRSAAQSVGLSVDDLKVALS